MVIIASLRFRGMDFLAYNFGGNFTYSSSVAILVRHCAVDSQVGYSFGCSIC